MGKHRFEIVEEKGLGEVVRELYSPRAIPGSSGHVRYAALVTDRDTDFICPRFNIKIINNPQLTGSSFGQILTFSEFYLFPEMVSEEEARKKYMELR